MGSFEQSKPKEAHSADSRSVAMVTAAAHKFGKPLVEHLARAGTDVAITSLALLSSRPKVIKKMGGRAIALRMNANDPASVRLALQAITPQFGALDLLVHIAPHELAETSSGLDPCSEAVASTMQGRGGAIIYLLGVGDSFPIGPARVWMERGVCIVGLRVNSDESPRAVGEAVVRAFRTRTQWRGQFIGSPTWPGRGRALPGEDADGERPGGSRPV